MSEQVFQTVRNEIVHKKELQAYKFYSGYKVSGEVTGQQSQVFSLTIEEGYYFDCKFITGQMVSYDAQEDSDYPAPNSLGVTSWAARGLSCEITDSNSSRKLTNGYVDMVLFCSPGYGLNFQQPFPWPYFFSPNSNIRFDVRNRDNADRSAEFEICLWGYKIVAQ